MKKLALLLAALAFSAFGADPTFSNILNAFQYRNLGPWRTGAWVTSLAVPESPAAAHRHVMFAGARTGGVWRTTNNGTTWEPVTDGVGIASVGAVAVAPSDANVVWVGTGDNSLTRSAYWGDGVYKSTDGGSTWANMGLRDTQHIARIVIDPSDPNTVWVAALGHLGTPNQERGVFRTTDGGKTWRKQLYRNETTGAVDLAIDYSNPKVLYAAMYDAIRLPWKMSEGGPGGGVFKTSDGGANWEKLSNGLPVGNTGRIGLDVCRANPKIVYAVIDNFSPRDASAQRAAVAGFAPPGAYIGGEVYRTDDSGAHWRRVSAEGEDVSRKAGYSFNQLRVDPNNPDRVFITGSNMIQSNDGGKTWAGLGGGGRGAYPFRTTFGDFRSLWIDPEDSEHMVATSDGGVSASYDGGRTSDHFANLKLGEFYAIGVDMQQPYNIYGGLQDHESWKGPSNGWSGRVNIDDWVTVGIGDGMYNQPDPTGRWLYNTQEFGTLGRVDLENRTRTIIDPTKPNAPHPFTNVRPLGARGAAAAAGSVLYRFNWIAPVRLSPHDHNTIYYGSQFLLRSKDRGDRWEVVSPDLTTNDPEKINTQNTSIQHCTIVTIDESPAQAGVIWVGTDDGKVQVTRDAGGALERRHGQSGRGGRTGRRVGFARVRVAFRAGDRLRNQIAAAAGRFQAVRLPHHGFRRHVDPDHRGPARSCGSGSHRGGHGGCAPAVPGNQRGRIRLVRWRWTLDAFQIEHASCARDRSAGAPARRRPCGGHIRPRRVGDQHRAAAGRRRPAAHERCRAASGALVRGAERGRSGQLPAVGRSLSHHCQRAERHDNRVLPEGRHEGFGGPSCKPKRNGGRRARRVRISGLRGGWRGWAAAVHHGGGCLGQSGLHTGSCRARRREPGGVGAEYVHGAHGFGRGE